MQARVSFNNAQTVHTGRCLQTEFTNNNNQNRRHEKLIARTKIYK